MTHPTQRDLFDFADGLQGPVRSAEIVAHLKECPRCRTACEALIATVNALGRLTPDRPSAQFTAKLLNRLGLREATPLWWLFLRNFAPVLAAGIVAGIIMALGSAGQGAQGGSVQKSLYDITQITEAVRGAMDGISAWAGSLVTRYLSFSLGKDSVSQMIFLACLFGGIGLLDRYILGPILRRRHQG